MRRLAIVALGTAVLAGVMAPAGAAPAEPPPEELIARRRLTGAALRGSGTSGARRVPR
jgi:hypothetical protein